MHEKHNIAEQTENFTGADLAGVINTAAMLAARRGGEYVEQSDFQTSLEKIFASRVELRATEDRNHGSCDVNSRKYIGSEHVSDSNSTIQMKILDHALRAFVVERAAELTGEWVGNNR